MMDIYYISAKGDKLNLVEWPYRIQTGDILNYKKSYTYSSMSRGGEILGFNSEITENNIVLTVSARTMEEYYTALNRFYDVVNSDVENLTQGKLYVNDQYLRCYIFGSKKTEWEYGCNFLDNTIFIVSEKPSWIREQKITYERKQASDTGYLDYPYDYTYDYSPNDMAVYLENTEVMPADFKLVIQGPCENPEVIIGQNKCQVMTTLSSYEYIVLNSMDRTVYKVSSTGTVTNVFESRNRSYENFAKIPQGKHIISINGTFKMEITMYMKRSEPRWT